MERINIELPRWLKRAVEDFAAKDGVSVNQYITLALAEKVGASGAAAFFAERGKGGDVERAVAFLEGRPQGVEGGSQNGAGGMPIPDAAKILKSGAPGRRAARSI